MAELKASNKFWTASNVVSMFRLVFTTPIAYALLTDQFWLAFWLCLFAAWTDWLDGFVARATKTVSEWGKVIDPVADKILVGTVVVILVMKGQFPLWFAITVVARDLIIVFASMYLRRHTPIVPPSLMSGKLAVSAISLAGVMAMIQLYTVRDWCIVLSCALMAVSLWQYGKRFYGIVRQAG